MYFIKMKNKKVLWCVILLMCLPAVFADTMLLVHLGERSIDYVYAVQDNKYYKDLFEASANQDFLEANDLSVQLLDSENVIVEQEIDSKNLGFVTAYLDEIKATETIKIVDGGEVFVEREINFCNDNDICEPCDDAGCLLAENVLVCSDCSYNSDDNFCDLSKDGSCDPDCTAQYDCDDCETSCLLG